jgi:riboflavin kinase/FMN adenylyltransferase
MRVFKELNQLPEFKNAVITIGTFDGVHKGHLQLIQRIRALANEARGESVIITFHPHPRLVINPQDDSLRLLSTIEEKIALLEKFGVDNVVIVPFSRTFSEQDAQEYISDFLVKHFSPAHIVIGYDHRFGKDRAGNIELLQELAPRFGYKVEEIPGEELEHITISSTKIRNALMEGDVQLANELLGHRYTLGGLVVKGLQNGRKLGYPTANIHMDEPYKLIPRTGVYAVRVKHREQWYGGMLNIGFNPTFEGKTQTIEVNILDFHTEIYGEFLTLEFIQYIRDEIKFTTLEDLIKAIDNDKVVITGILASTAAGE